MRIRSQERSSFHCGPDVPSDLASCQLEPKSKKVCSMRDSIRVGPDQIDLFGMDIYVTINNSNCGFGFQ